MLKSYLVAALRNLWRHKAYSAINIAGLSIGLAFALVALQSVQAGIGWDDFHANGDRLYRVIRETRGADGSVNFSSGTSGLLGPTMMDEFPEVAGFVRYSGHGGPIQYGETSLHARFLVADDSLFELMTFPFVAGDRGMALKDPYTAVVTESFARKLFGDEDPLGKVMTGGNKDYHGDYVITGVLKDVPEKSTISFDYITATKILDSPWTPWPIWQPHGTWRPLRTYILLHGESDSADLEQKLPQFMAKQMGPEVAEVNDYHLQPVEEMRLYSNRDYQMGSSGITELYMLSTLALFILLIACINYTNLATALFASRAREVGMRKVVGARAAQVARQFLIESAAVSFISLVVWPRGSSRSWAGC